jgi:hypothetical protein
MERLFQKNERDSIGLKPEKLFFHDVAGNDKVFHENPLKFQTPNSKFQTISKSQFPNGQNKIV